MRVWIVFKNGMLYPENVEVFDNKVSAEHHAKMLNKKWSTTSILEKEVKSL